MKKTLVTTLVSLTSFFVLTSIVNAAGAVEVGVQATNAINTVGGLIDTFTKTIVKSLGTLAMAAAVVAFFYGVIEYIWGQRKGEEKAVSKGREFMLWGLIALFVMFSVYGIINFGQRIFFNDEDLTKITIPEFNFVRGSGSGLGTSGPSSSTGGATNQNPLGTSNAPSAGAGRGYVNPPASTQSPSQVDYGCGAGKGYPDPFGSCATTPTPTPSASTQSDGNVGECNLGASCTMADGSDGNYGSGCVCGQFIDP